MSSTTARLQVRALNKTFGSVQVLTDVELSVLAGEVHGLAGQNGSGKSTLIKILTGLYTPDAGADYHVDGNAMRLPVRWREVRAAGISVVHQDLGLLDQLTVAENICVGGFPTSRVIGRIDRAERDKLAARTLQRLGVELDPTTPVASLNAPERAEVAIARAMRDHATGGGLIILDESTRALSGEDLTRVHAMLRRITADGSAALMISHNLTELMNVTDRMTILRDGRLAGAGLLTRELTEEEIAHRMLGGSLGQTVARSATPAPVTAPTVAVTGLAGKQVHDVEFALGAGEILGITGLPGNGYEEIPYLLTGAQPSSSGTISTPATTVDLTRAGVAGCLRAGVVLVPERRDRDGLAFELSMRDNISLPGLRKRGHSWFVGRKWQREDAEAALESLDIRPRTPSILIKQLSGGNQQKVLLAKWLTMGPTVLVLHEPTQAVDVGARQDILHALRRAADSGTAVILVSSEPDDLCAACDRILIYSAATGLVESTAGTAEGLVNQIYAAEDESAGSRQ
ncbi:MAG: ribose transport system ATP-binding protein [Pseudonocardiales bacterium]|nr:ribose transport system ATP-binding protein [Pseudonocardiales bacterium]